MNDKENPPINWNRVAMDSLSSDGHLLTLRKSLATTHQVQQLQQGLQTQNQAQANANVAQQAQPTQSAQKPK